MSPVNRLHEPRLAHANGEVPREQAMREANELLTSVDERYTRALDHAAQVQGSESIEAAFDEVQRLRREMISAIRRVRKLARETGEVSRAEANSS
jgi:hypothetical protein